MSPRDNLTKAGVGEILFKLALSMPIIMTILMLIML
jgi:hypothetical protein